MVGLIVCSGILYRFGKAIESLCDRDCMPLDVRQ